LLHELAQLAIELRIRVFRECHPGEGEANPRREFPILELCLVQFGLPLAEPLEPLERAADLGAGRGEGGGVGCFELLEQGGELRMMFLGKGPHDVIPDSVIPDGSIPDGSGHAVACLVRAGRQRHDHSDDGGCRRDDAESPARIPLLL
jgi:hypothetical protein